MLKTLSDASKNKIRAGVTATSYAQCVEELVLNAIDANATCIAVRVDFNVKKLQVIDNGIGIRKEDLAIVGERYHTSKCSSLNDIDLKLQHYGYRGEAIASIGNICYLFDIETRSKDVPNTYIKIFRQGAQSEIKEATIQRPSHGTTFTVFDLFHAMPVRNRSLNQALELERIRQRVEAAALIHPKISFSVKNEVNGNKILQTHKANSVVGTFTYLYGNNKSRSLCEVKHQSKDFEVFGFISKDGNSNKNLQFVYINNRLVLKTKIHKLINTLMGKTVVLQKKGFYNRTGAPKKWSPGNSTEDVGPSKHTERHAIYIINILCPLSCYDITFDPSKTLIEFTDWEIVLNCIEEAVKQFIKEESLVLETGENSKGGSWLEVLQNSENNSQEDEDNETKDLNKTKYGKLITTENITYSLHSEVVKNANTNTVELTTKSENCDEGNGTRVLQSSASTTTAPEEQFKYQNYSLNENCHLQSIPGEIFTKAYLKQQEKKPSLVLQENLSSKNSSKAFKYNLNEFSYAAIKKKVTDFQENMLTRRKNKAPKDSQKELTKSNHLKVGCETNDSKCVTSDIFPSEASFCGKDTEFINSNKSNKHLTRSPKRRDKTYGSWNSKPSTSTSILSVSSYKKRKSSVQQIQNKYNLMSSKKRKSTLYKEKRKRRLWELKTKSTKLSDLKMRSETLSYKEPTRNYLNEDPLGCISKESNEQLVTPSCSNSDDFLSKSNNVSNTHNLNLDAKTYLTPLKRIRQRLLAKAKLKTTFKTPDKITMALNDSPVRFKKHADVTKHKKSVKFKPQSVLNQTKDCSFQSEKNAREQYDRQFFASTPVHVHSALDLFKTPIDPQSMDSKTSNLNTDVMTEIEKNVTTTSSLSCETCQIETHVSQKENSKNLEKNSSVSNNSCESKSTFETEEILLTQDSSDHSTITTFSTEVTDHSQNVSKNSLVLDNDSLNTISRTISPKRTTLEFNFDNPTKFQVKYVSKTLEYDIEILPVDPVVKSCKEKEMTGSRIQNQGDPESPQFLENTKLKSSFITDFQNSSVSSKESKLHNEVKTPSNDATFELPSTERFTSCLNDDDVLHIESVSKTAKSDSHTNQENLFDRVSFKYSGSDNGMNREGGDVTVSQIFPNLKQKRDKKSTSSTESTVGQYWVCKTNPQTGSKFYVNVLTGHTSLKPPEVSSHPVSTKSDDITMTQLFKNWENPMFQQPDSLPINIEYNASDAQKKRMQESVQFTKDMLFNLQVVNQVDNKFIACLLRSPDDEKKSGIHNSSMLVVIDQHAAHERIRLEQFILETHEDNDLDKPLKRSRIKVPLEVHTTEDTVRLMVAYSQYFLKIGIEFTVVNRDEVSVTAVPYCFVQEAVDMPFLLRQIQLLVREQIDVLEKTHGSNASLPKTIHNVLASRACHGAIKFGVPLTHDKCEELVKQLQFCCLPFQCAHGRPSIMPLLDLEKINNQHKHRQPDLPKLWKLKK